MNIGIFGNVGNRGPGKVFQNTIRGLKELGHNVTVNASSDYNGCITMGDHPPDTLMGPNVMVIPPEHPNFWSKYKNYIVPSKWVYDKYKSFDLTQNTNIHIWSAGIDSEFFKPQKNIRYDCFVYFKNRSGELNAALSFLDMKKLTYKIIKYGSYSEQELIETCNQSRFCILIDNTESQGIAVMEIMSLDVPIYVLDYKVWNNRFPATSVPYFDERCGMIEHNLNQKSFEIFEKEIDNYEPRKYILENHTLGIAAEKYIELLKITKEDYF